MLTPRQEHFYHILPYRTLAVTRALHYLVTDEGVLCLDLNVNGDSLEEVDRQVKAWIAGHDGDAILPAAPRSDWERYAALHPPIRSKATWKRYELVRFNGVPIEVAALKG